MAIKKIKLPDNTTEDINDPRLPAVSATDNGKILSVSGGIWSANSKPSYTLDEVSDGSIRKLANCVTLSGAETITGTKTISVSGYGNQLVIRRNEINYDAMIRFENAEDGLLGYLGIRGSGTAASERLAYSPDGVSDRVYAIYHSGNSNKSDVAWACSTLTVSGTLSVNGPIYLTDSNQINYIGSNPTILGLAFNYTSGDTTNGIPIRFFNGKGGEIVRFTEDGNVGIGTTAPEYKLDVNGSACFRYFAVKDDTACYWGSGVSNGALSWDSGKAYVWGINGNALCLGGGGYSNSLQLDSSGAHFGVSVDITGGLTTTGNVGIGTNSPAQKLHVDGNILATGTITPGSDSRIKDNQKEIATKDAFFIIENLKPKTWIWNEKTNESLEGKCAAGLVAQEVKEILPDAVTISENGDIKDFHSLNYNVIQGYEIAAIKGLIEEVKSLKTEITELKEQIK